MALADETFIGKLDGIVRSGKERRGGHSSYKNTILTLVERGGSARSFHVEGTAIADLIPIIRANVVRESAMMTDAASWYRNLKTEVGLASHQTVDHSKEEYVRPGGIHTNTVEGYYSIFKRGMRGIYQWCSEKHLHRYHLNELFDKSASCLSRQ